MSKMPTDIEVERWISYPESEGKTDALGGMGGYFSHGMRWDTYLGNISAAEVPYAEAVRREVIKNNIRMTGEAHQHGPAGVPLFNDGMVASFSYRAWGDLMAAIWSEHENKDYSYMDFYM
jgi:hypothetical protein